MTTGHLTPLAGRGRSVPASDIPGLRPARQTVRPPVAPSRSSPQLVQAAIAAGAAAVVLLWWRNTGALLTPAEWLINAGRLTGLLAGYAVVVLVALMARVPRLERGIGADRLARWHGWGGRYTVTLATAHAVLILWGYTVEAETSPLEQSRTLLLTYPGVLAATVALALFLVVGATSARAARRRMRYETWHFVHFYTYLAVALSFSHQLATGAEFAEAPSARLAWLVLYAGVGILVLWYRWLTPLRLALRHRLRVAEIYPEGPGVTSIVLRGRHLDELGASGGEFFRWRFLSRDHWWAANPYSLSAAPRADEMRITVQEVGDHSRSLWRLRTGTRVLAEGPYGGLAAAPRRQPRVLLLAGGMGITPMRALFETIEAEPGALTLVYRASTPSDVLFQDELEALAAQRGAQVRYAIGPRGGPGDPCAPGVLHRMVPFLRRHEVYICASPGLTAALIGALRAEGVARARIHTETFEL
jgi:predicted ferric reductase